MIRATLRSSHHVSIRLQNHYEILTAGVRGMAPSMYLGPRQKIAESEGPARAVAPKAPSIPFSLTIPFCRAAENFAIGVFFEAEKGG